LNFVEACRKFIAIESTPANGNKELALFAGSLAQAAGLHVEYEHESQAGLEQTNVIIRPSREKPEDELLLETHLDTVDPGNYAHWTKTQANPFNASIIDNKIYGLGSADTKLDFLCKLEAIKNISDRKIKWPYVLVGTFGAQSGMTGAVRLVRRKLIRAKRALIGEPTGLGLAHAGPGMVVVEVSIPFSEQERAYRLRHDLEESASTQSKMFYGKAAHSSEPRLGDNAIVKMLDYLGQLPSSIAVMDMDGGVNYNSVPSSSVLEIDLVGGFQDPIVPKIHHILAAFRAVEDEFQKYPDPDFPLAAATMNIGMIRTFEDQVRVTGSCRLPPSVPTGALTAWMDRLRIACEEKQSTFRVRDAKTSFYTTPESPWVRDLQGILVEMGLSSELKKLLVNTEASVFHRLGIECVVCGPGQSVGNSHQPNESINIDELEKATQFYQRVLERFCL